MHSEVSQPIPSEFAEIADICLDVIVAGAGPGGCSAALQLAERGLNVLLLDKAIFPRPKVCGDGLASSSVKIFEEMGVLDKLEAAGAHKITEILLSAPDGTVVSGKPARGSQYREYALVLPRRILDAVLLEHVKCQPHVRVIEGAKVSGLLRDGDQVCGVHVDFFGEKRTLRSRFIIGADGAHSVVAAQLGAKNIDRRHRSIALRGYFDEVAGLSDRIEIHCDSSLLPGYGWVFPTGESSANVGIILSSRYSTSKPVRALFDDFVRLHPLARRNLERARLVNGTLAGGPLPCGSFLGPRSRANVLLVGDAASFIDPLTGEGIYYALQSGSRAAEAICTALEAGKPDGAGPLYEKLWRKDFKWKEFIPSSLLQPIFRRPALVNTALRATSSSKARSEVLLGAIGHTLPKTKLVLPF